MIESEHHETPESVGSHYDDLDEFYREIWGLHVHHGLWRSGKESSFEATEALTKHLLNDAGLTSSSHVCDVGCGYGETSRYIAEHYAAQVTGFSVSRAQLETARRVTPEHLVPRLKFVLGDWLQNRLEDGTFDLVLAIESTEHMPDIERFFSEAYRVLIPGGRLRICAWLSKENPRPWEKSRLLRPICTEGRLRLCSKSEYESFIQKAGFSGCSFEELTDQVKRTWTLCLKRVFKKLVTDPKYLRYLLKDPSRNKMFLKSLLRIRVAYETRSMIYGIFSATK